MKFVGSSLSDAWYGQGLYSTSSPAGAYKFAKGGKGIFVVNVACGRARIMDVKYSKPSWGPMKDFVRQNQYTWEDPKTGNYDSRIIRNPGNADIDGPGGTIASTDEIVVFDDDAMIPRYLIVFQ